jgi:group I intron endonuclease
MLFCYNGCSKLSGIYEIRNRHTNRSYIGQAKEFCERWNSHKYSLLKNKNQNKFFLNDFNKCKEELVADNFLEFHILEVMECSTKQERNEREEWWIAEYKKNGYRLYNFQEKVSQLDHIWSSCPEETKQKISNTLKQKWKDPSFREAITNSLKGENNPFYGKTHTLEIRKRISNGRKKSTPWNKGKILKQFSGENHPMFGKENHWGQHSEETKKKMSQKHKGKRLSNETRKKISEAMKARKSKKY